MENEKRYVIIVGVLDNPDSSNLWMATSFLRHGYHVIPINYRTILARHDMTYLANLLLYTIDKYSPSLIIFCKCNGVDPKIVEKASLKTKTWLYFMDSFFIVKEAPEILQHAKYSTFSSCTSEITVSFFKDNGVENCHHVFEGIDQSIHKPVEPIKKFEADISFIGSATEERNKYKKLLEDAGYNVKFYGHGYSMRSPSMTDWAKICASSKFMLSINTFSNVPTYFSGRLFEYLGCGVCTFHLDNTNSLNKYLEDGKEVIYFVSPEDLIEKLSSISIEEAGRIALAGREKVVNNYTFDHSVHKIIKIAGV